MKATDRATSLALALVILTALTPVPVLSARSSCRATLRLGGSGAAANGRSARASLCFDRAGASCDPQDVKGTSVVPGPGFEGVVAALDALKADAAPVCTVPASVRVATLSPSSLDLIRRWIAAGAPETASF